ncbi:MULTISPECIES: outer membrane protein assembly factor BamD [unclassified Campylobacter]|uniref:outer membrane protein assembly factor BamD n=1 Tax=unclassified Campylobacter TaxID=2593542 RepID=UPI001237B24E|nr:MULTISPECIES: outer membrane protein assembly factor BamD [unclassified Campylobacter]KAA6225951.1 outer membrane protein assembly factor BamD [Campylobacter sp. LR286c]KAA6228161.1 outer membrane protein assembly factor BamD [Campylobacter sp. LR185c]KAA6228814.1 outer membrane protein assembly factor BamD [Campylobacter sp. LR196d]KAA6231215.1 outer membrane protein assembly factor BamD [Campylobacter sp. LR291e]KAA6234376.1 outer membrane protein assembly factor BamD [Campylobacter sp. L
MKITYLLIFLFLFSACSVKDTEELYNLSATQWYKQIIQDLQDRDLESADTHYNGMASEHIADPLLETTLIILAQAHMDEEEYQLADFYLEEYNKKFGTSRNVDYIRYFKIKAKFDAFGVPNRNQSLMLESKNEIDSFLKDYPDTEFKPLVQTMLMKFNLAEFYLNESIADLYKRTDREESYEIYQQRLMQSEFHDEEMIKPELPWYRAIFETF